jgi:hypothetical protein
MQKPAAVPQTAQQLAPSKPKQNRKSVCKGLSRFDVFGQTIDMNFNGDSTYKTNLGAILSITMACIVGLFTALKMMQLVTHENFNFIMNSVLKDMYAEYPEPFYARENHFEFAVTFLSIRPYKFVKHNPRFGHINVRMTHMDNTREEIVFEKHPLRMSPCDPERDFQRDHTQDYFLRNIT